MKRWGALVVILMLAAAGAPAEAAKKKPAAPVAPPATIDAGAVSALNDMGAYLRTLKAMQVSAVISREDVLTDGQKVQVNGTATLLAQRPDRLRAEVTTDEQQRVYFYDGTTFTLYAPRMEYYATAPAPPTILGLVDLLAEKFDIELPFVDLFRWGAEGRTTPAITSAIDVGPSQVEGTSCEQYALRQEGKDWQIWIQKGPYPLPRRLVITTMTDEARPQYQSELTWNLAPAYNDAAFVFDPPTTAQKIVFQADTAAGAAGTSGGAK